MRPPPAYVALLTILAAGSASALDCKNATTQADLNQCAGQRLGAADRRLNRVYQAYADRLSAPSRAGLKRAQRAWIAFRDAECGFRAGAVEGGSIQPMVAAQCRTGLTEARAKALESLVACPEGDVSCPR